MRLTAETVTRLTLHIAPLDTEEHRQAYREGRFARADLVQDLNKRYRWDLFYAARAYRALDQDELAGACITDAHIDTALRRIVRPL